MSLCCPNCRRPTVPGLTRTEEAIVTKLAFADGPMRAADIGAGLSTDIRSLAVLMNRLRVKLKPQGWTISSNPGRHNGVYELMKL